MRLTDKDFFGIDPVKTIWYYPTSSGLSALIEIVLEGSSNLINECIIPPSFRVRVYLSYPQTIWFIAHSSNV